MCGRYQMSVSEKDITVRFNVDVYEKLYRPGYNCAPSQKLPVIKNTEPDKLSFLKWGLIPFWSKDPKIGAKMINAKGETIDQKPSFRTAFKQKRCLVPSNGFYEWRMEGKEKTPYRIYVKDTVLFSLAGIWDSWKDAEGYEIQSFSIITTNPNPLMELIHTRMPVILDEESEKTWLQETNPQILKELLKPFPAEKMEAYPISKLANSPKNNSSEIQEAKGKKLMIEI
jgi:putative SOS response-associated peptidase YedK